MQAPVPITTDGPMDIWKHGLIGFLFRNSTAVHCLHWRNVHLLSNESNFGIDRVLLTSLGSGIKLTWSIYRFGRLVREALVKEVKFADWAGFLFSSEFPTEGNGNGRYDLLWNNVAEILSPFAPRKCVWPSEALARWVSPKPVPSPAQPQSPGAISQRLVTKKIPQEGLASLRRSEDGAIPDRLKLSFYCETMVISFSKAS